MNKIITNYSFVTISGNPFLNNYKTQFVNELKHDDVYLIGEVSGDSIVTSPIIKVDTRMRYAVTQLGSKFFLGEKSIEYEEYLIAIKKNIPILEKWKYEYKDNENICIFKGVINGVEKETSVVNFIEDKKDCKKNGYLFLFDNEEVFVNWGNPGEHNIIDDSFDMYAGRKIKPKFNKK